VNILQSDEIAFMCHIHSLQSSVQPHLNLFASDLFITRAGIALTNQDLLGVTQKDASVSEILDSANGLLNF
jgi:hypothetical protein